MSWTFIGNLLQKWPGRKQFGIYRFMPLFFVFGACIELTMINLRVADVGFYDVYKRKHPEVVAAVSSSSKVLIGPRSSDPKANSLLLHYEKYLQEKTQSN